MFKNTSNKKDAASSSSTSCSDISEEQEITSKPQSKIRSKRSLKSDNTEGKLDKKKKKKTVTICLTNCRYEVIRKVAQNFGLKEVGEGDNWNMYWTDLSISIERCKEMKRFQRINHFPGKYPLGFAPTDLRT